MRAIRVAAQLDRLVLAEITLELSAVGCRILSLAPFRLHADQQFSSGVTCRRYPIRTLPAWQAAASGLPAPLAGESLRSGRSQVCGP